MVHRRQDSSELLPLVHRKPKPTHLLRLFLLFSLFSLLAFLFSYFIFFLPLLTHSLQDQQTPSLTPPPCSSLPNNTICCDRSSIRSDLCFMRGHILANSHSNSLFLLTNTTTTTTPKDETIRPYTRKWEPTTMASIDQLRLRPTNQTSSSVSCDVQHDVPAVFFSTGGYTGNVYHEFNDGLIPLYITSHRFNKKVVFVILEYHDWWISKYDNILSHLSDFPPIDFRNDNRTHCFPEAIVGLDIHDELAIDPTKMTNNRTIRDFRRLLDDSYRPRIEELEGTSQEKQSDFKLYKPRLVIVSRNGSRGIENERQLVKLADQIGFQVEVLTPDKTTELAKIYKSLNSSDVMIGVHGAAMTHLLFMRPGSVFIQIVPLGTDWAAETYYGEPAKKLGLKYIGYRISPEESSLYREYAKDDAVLRDPESVNAKGWEVTKKVYLDGQSVNLDLERFKKRLVRAYGHVVVTRRGKILKHER